MRLLNADGRHCSIGFQPVFARHATRPTGKMPMLPCSRPIVRRSGRHPAQVQPPFLLLALQRESAHDQGAIH